MDIANRLIRAVHDAQLRAHVHRCAVVRIWMTPEDVKPLRAVAGVRGMRHARFCGYPITVSHGGVSRVVLADGYVVRV